MRVGGGVRLGGEGVSICKEIRISSSHVGRTKEGTTTKIFFSPLFSSKLLIIY